MEAAAIIELCFKDIYYSSNLDRINRNTITTFVIARAVILTYIKSFRYAQGAAQLLIQAKVLGCWV